MISFRLERPAGWSGEAIAKRIAHILYADDRGVYLKDPEQPGHSFLFKGQVFGLI